MIPSGRNQRMVGLLHAGVTLLIASSAGSTAGSWELTFPVSIAFDTSKLPTGDNQSYDPTNLCMVQTRTFTNHRCDGCRWSMGAVSGDRCSWVCFGWSQSSRSSVDQPRSVSGPNALEKAVAMVSPGAGVDLGGRRQSCFLIGV